MRRMTKLIDKSLTDLRTPTLAPVNFTVSPDLLAQSDVRKWLLPGNAVLPPLEEEGNPKRAVFSTNWLTPCSILARPLERRSYQREHERGHQGHEEASQSGREYVLGLKRASQSDAHPPLKQFEPKSLRTNNHTYFCSSSSVLSSR